jgi:hypothetical protein
MNELISIILVLLMATPRERVGNLARSSTVTHNPIPTHAPTNQTCALHTGASPPALLAQHLDLMGESFPGVFIRAPAILSAGPGVKVLAKVVATPCRQAAVVLRELERKMDAGEKVVTMGVVDALERKSSQEISYKQVKKDEMQEEKKEIIEERIELPGAADGTNAREVICVVRKDNILCTAFHPELTQDYRWHEYFANMVRESMAP